MMFSGIKNKNLESPKFPSSLGNNLVHMVDIGVRFGQNSALKDINLSIAKSEILFVTGNSGAGKTTLLKTISGDINPTSGVLTYQSLSGKKPFISTVDQRIRLIEKLSCKENLLFSYDPSIYESEKEFDDDLHELCKIFGIYDRLNIKIKDANGGLRQKISVIRALLSKPDLFVADEPTSSLDYDNAKLLFDVLSIYNTKINLTILWATHNKELVRKFTGKMIHLDKGKLIYSGHACFI